MATAQEMKTWLDTNADKAGSPDYVKVTEAYGRMAGGGLPQDDPFSDVSGPAGVGSAWTDEASRTDPNTPGNIARRVGTGALTGLPDLAISGINALSRHGILPEIPGGPLQHIGPRAIEAVGGLPMAAYAGETQQLLEGGASALLGGGAQAAARAAAMAPTATKAIIAALTKLGTTTALPTTASHYGAQTGESVARAAGLDPETGALLGSLAGFVPGAVGPSATRFTDWRYRGMGKADAPEIAAAARAEGVELPASALGNESLRLRENSYANRWGAGSYTNEIRGTARNQLGTGVENMAAARGALDPTPTRGSLGTGVGDIATRGAAEGNRIVSDRQDYLQSRVGPGVGDISGLLDELRGIANSTDALTAGPVEGRIAALERRLPPIDPATGARPNYDMPYQPIKDMRTGTRETYEGVGGITGRYAGQVEDAFTGHMRDTAAANGVPPEVFDRIQQFTARMKGINDVTGEKGPIPRLEEVTRQVTSNPETGYNFLKRGEQKPANLSLLQQTGQPDVNTLFGDYIRRLGQETINNPNQGAPGPRQFATRIENMNAESKPLLFGPQQEQAERLALIARALNAPTRQGGLGQTMGQITPSIPGALTAGEIGAGIGSATGVPGAPTVGRTIGYMMGPAQRAIGGRMMQSPTARNALERGPLPDNYGMSDLLAAINAIAAPNTQGAPLPPRRQ